MTTYSKYKTTKYWKLIDAELKSLEKNQDITITTSRDNVIGALVKKILDNDKAKQKKADPSA